MGTSEDLGLTWKSYACDHFIVHDRASEGTLYEGKVKTEDSRGRIAIPKRIRPYIEGWRRVWPISDKIGIPRKSLHTSGCQHICITVQMNQGKQHVTPEPNADLKDSPPGQRSEIFLAA